MLLLRRERAARSSPRSFTLTSRDRVPKSHAREQDVKYFDSADYSLQQVRAVCGLAGRAHPRARAEHPVSFFAHPTHPNRFPLRARSKTRSTTGGGGRAHVAREDGQLPAEVEHVQVIGVRA